jgi:rubredoxin
MSAEAVKQFTCDNCGETYDCEWSDEEAQAEAVSTFGVIDDPAIVCDDCYQKLMGWLKGARK